MKTEYLKLIKIDHDTNTVVEEPLDNNGNISDYVINIINTITQNTGDRFYRFKDTDLTMKTWIDAIVDNENRDEKTLAIASRLLDKENAAQQRYHTITDIQKGILLIAYCKMTDEGDFKMIICKADYTEFIEETTGEKKNGLPTKKKIFKSFSANIKVDAGAHIYGDIITYDVNSTQAKYWYDEFLDLMALRNDEENMKRAFSSINAKILDPIRKDHKSDYLYLWNTTVAYMRCDGEFNMHTYADDVLAAYHPVGEGLNMNELAAKAKELPEKFNFDSRFQRVPSAIKAKSKKEIRLTNDIDLVLKNDIPHIGRTIKPYMDENGKKYIMVNSEDGFKYAEKLEVLEKNQEQ